MHQSLELWNTKYIVIVWFVILFGSTNSFAAEPIMITLSDYTYKIIFDGKWTDVTEWKESSLNTISYNDGAEIQLRTSHDRNFIYVLVDFVSDVHLDKESDSATICFDTNANKTIPGVDGYCIVAILDDKTFYVLQGDPMLGFDNNSRKISLSNGFIGIGSVSDENDRYSKIPHTSYEFRIPAETIGRSNVYGFYVGVYDARSNNVYSWPTDIESQPNHIPSSDVWGELISPDKTLPEFHLPLLVMVSVSFFISYLIQRKKLPFINS